MNHVSYVFLLFELLSLSLVNSLPTQQAFAKSVARDCDVSVLIESFYHQPNAESIQCKKICPPSKVSDSHRKYCRNNCPAYYNCVIEGILDQCTAGTELNRSAVCFTQCFDAVVSRSQSGDLPTQCQLDGECSGAVSCMLEHVQWKTSSAQPTTSEPLTTSSKSAAKRQQTHPTTDSTDVVTLDRDVSTNKNATNVWIIVAVVVPVAVAAVGAVICFIVVIRRGRVARNLEKQNGHNGGTDSEGSPSADLEQNLIGAGNEASSNVASTSSSNLSDVNTDWRSDKTAEKTPLKAEEESHSDREHDGESDTESRSNVGKPIQCTEDLKCNQQRIETTDNDNDPYSSTACKECE